MSGIEIHEISKTLGGPSGSAVLRGVTFRVPPGHCVGVQGATGSGKTTLLRLIAGLERPDRGEIRLEGRVVNDARTCVSPAERKIGFVFQSLGLWPHLTVESHLDYVLAATGWSPEECTRHKAEAGVAFHLQGLEQRRPAELSGGEKRLLAMARALVADARILLLDEPFTGLDGHLKERVMQALGKWLEQRKLTALLVSHEPNDLARLCRGTVHLREGQVVEKAGVGM